MAISRPVTTRINAAICNGCGLCVQVCPSQTISLINGKAVVSGHLSLSCGHCAAACPENAVRVNAICPESAEYLTFSTDSRWLPHGEFDTSLLVRLMRSRRSCRNYTNQAVDRRLLEDLIKIGATAPSGTNCQRWAFTLLPTRKEVLFTGNQIAGFFRRMNHFAEKPLLRFFLKRIGKKQLDRYYRDFYDSVKEGLYQWEKNERDLLFHGAPSAIIVSSRPGASCPQEDALLATQNILLAAHSMGLGSCLVGFAAEAIKNDSSIKRSLSIPDEEDVYAVIALGYPAEKYQFVAGRKKIVFRYTTI